MARLVRGLARAWKPVLVGYVLLMAFAGWFVQRLPTGFIPSLDRAILIISLQLPPGASLARTDAVVRQATELVLGDARRQVLQRLHRPQRRHVHLRPPTPACCSWCSTISRSGTS